MLPIDAPPDENFWLRHWRTLIMVSICSRCAHATSLLHRFQPNVRVRTGGHEQKLRCKLHRPLLIEITDVDDEQTCRQSNTKHGRAQLFPLVRFVSSRTEDHRPCEADCTPRGP